MTQIFGVAGQGSSNTERSLKACTVLTRMLRQHDIVFEALKAKYRDQIATLLEKQDTKSGYLVVGVKTCVDAEIADSEEASKTGSMFLEVPVQQTIAAFGAATPFGELANPKITVNKTNAQRILSRFVATGERVFAIQVREVKWEGWFSKDLQMRNLLQMKTRRKLRHVWKCHIPTIEDMDKITVPTNDCEPGSTTNDQNEEGPELKLTPRDEALSETVLFEDLQF